MQSPLATAQLMLIRMRLMIIGSIGCCCYVKTRLDEKRLTEMALTTNGVYFRAGAGSREIEGVYNQIANMEQKELGSQRLARYEERYQIPLALALIFFAVQALLSERRAKSSPWQGRFA